MNLHYNINNLIPEDRISERTANLVSSVSRDSLFEVNMIIYKATNRINGKVYIGQTTYTLPERIKSHKHEANSSKKNHYFSNAVKKYGVNCFKWQVICICPNIDSLNKQEKYYIAFYNSMNIGYNRTSGGKDYFFSNKSREKMSKAQCGINNPRYGVIVSKETRKKMSIKRKKGVGVKAPHYGKNHSFIAKEKMSKAHKEITKRRIRDEKGRFIGIKIWN